MVDILEKNDIERIVFVYGEIYMLEVIVEVI